MNEAVGQPVAGNGRRRRGLSIAATLIISLGVGFVVWHIGSVVDCNKALGSYRQQKQALERAVKDSADQAKATVDDVPTGQKQAVERLQADMKRAQTLLNKSVDEHQCASTNQTVAITEAGVRLQAGSGELKELAGLLTTEAEVVKQARHAKQLNDARVALRSTILSAKRLSGSQWMRAETRAKLNQTIANAGAYLESTDVASIGRARRQMDSLIDQINQLISATNAELLQIEERLRATPTVADGNGNYAQSATNIVNAAGLKVVWGLEQMRGYCTITEQNIASWMAAFCTGAPGNVYINNRMSARASFDRYFADAMRHEVGHYLIFRRCGTTEPASIGSQANAESTASSYAVLYLGANANTLNRATDARYHMDELSDQAAARIHAGQCE